MNKVGRPRNTGGIAPPLADSQIKTLLRVTASSTNPERNLAIVHLLLTGLRVSEPTFITRAMVTDPKGKVPDSFVQRTICSTMVTASCSPNSYSVNDF